ncbi:MAG: hypothetical protein GY757_47270, partial [bacterium]|nr:hypothetical protein [bacterium]
NQEYQFEDLVEKVLAKRDRSRNPLFAHALVSLEMEARNTAATENEPQEQEGEGLTVKPYEHGRKVSKFDMGFYYAEVEGKLKLIAEYATRLYKKEKVEQVITYFKEILTNVLEDPQIRLEDIRLSSDLGKIETNVVQADEGDFGF